MSEDEEIIGDILSEETPKENNSQVTERILTDLNKALLIFIIFIFILSACWQIKIWFFTPIVHTERKLGS